MDQYQGFRLDSNTVKDCGEPAAAVKFAETESRTGFIPSYQGPIQKSVMDCDISDQCDSAYGSECLSTGSRFASTSDVSERLKGLHIANVRPAPEVQPGSFIKQEHRSSENSGRTVRAQKRAAEEPEDVVLTSDAYDQDEEGDTPLSRSIIYEKPDIALKFIRYTPDPSFFSIRNCLGQTPLMLSVLTGQVQVCRALVVAGASVDIQDKEGNTALHQACSMKNFLSVQALTAPIHQVEIRTMLSSRNHRHPQNLSRQLGLKNYEGLTPVHLATFQGNCQLLQYLVAHGADINEPDGKSGRTALHFAVEMNLFNLVQALITTLGANVDAVTFDLCTPLHLAAGRGHIEIAYMLHGAGADTQVQNFEGQCACELTEDRELQELITPCSSDCFY